MLAVDRDDLLLCFLRYCKGDNGYVMVVISFYHPRRLSFP